MHFQDCGEVCSFTYKNQDKNIKTQIQYYPPHFQPNVCCLLIIEKKLMIFLEKNI